MRWLSLTALLALAAISTLNWRAQQQTQYKLDALIAALAERPAPAPAEPTRSPEVPAQERRVPRELEDGVTIPPYIIEARDELRIEVALKHPETGETEPLPEQPISGRFMVRLDGTVSLGKWGSAFVSGMTCEQAARAIREEVKKSAAKIPAESLVVTVDLLEINSKFYYVIFDSEGFGEAVSCFRYAGSETVLDAIANIGLLWEIAAKRSIYVMRRTTNPGQPWQELPVDWKAITQQGITTTNYQLLPNDRLYVTMVK